MSYILTPITSSGITVDNYVGFGVYADLLTISSGNVTLAGNVAINPTVVSGQTAGFSVRWNAELTLSTFSVSICGFTINQSDVNQSGTFSCYYNGSSWSVQYFPDATQQPQVYYGVNAVTAATSGTTTWVAGVDKFYQRVSGAPTTLVGNLIYTAATAGVKDGTQMTVQIAGGITVSSSSLIVFGLTISAYDALNGGVAVVATYDATAGVWRSYQTSKQIVIGALGSISGNTVVCNPISSTQAPTTLEFTSDGDVLQRAGGALVASKLNQGNFEDNILVGNYAATNISNANIKLLFTTPYALTTLSLASGSTNLPYLVLVEIIYGSAAFTTETTLNIRITGAANPIFTQVGALQTTSSNIFMFVPVTGTISTSQLLKNAGLELYCPSANPAVGTGSTMKIHCFYNQQILS